MRVDGRVTCIDLHLCCAPMAIHPCMQHTALTVVEELAQPLVRGTAWRRIILICHRGPASLLLLYAVPSCCEKIALITPHETPC
jgi:hypothetical protein